MERFVKLFVALFIISVLIDSRTTVPHKIAHAVARHGNERISQQMIVHLGGVVLSEAIKEKPAETQAIFGSTYCLGAQYGLEYSSF